MKESKFKRFLTSNVTLLVLSFLIAFIIWFVISANSQTETNVTISDIPISIELPQEAIDDNLKIFSGNEVTGSVEVSGNRVTVGSLTGEDISITASNANTILTPGTYTLQLAAKKSGSKTNYNIVASSLNPTNITIFVDRESEKEYQIENELVFEVPEGYYASSTLSDEFITLAGPESDLAQIDKVVVKGTVEGTITDSKEIQKNILYIDSNGEELNLPLVESNLETVTVSLNVLKAKNVNIALDYLNKPTNAPAITYKPGTAKIAATDTVLDNITNDTISVGTLDFSKLRNESYNLTYDIVLPTGSKLLSKYTKTIVSIDLTSYDKTKLTCSFKNDLDDSKYKVEFTQNSIEPVVYGSSDKLQDLLASNLKCTAKIDPDKLKNMNKTVSIDVPISFEFDEGFKDCWVYGDYAINATITEK